MNKQQLENSPLFKYSKTELYEIIIKTCDAITDVIKLYGLKTFAVHRDALTDDECLTIYKKKQFLKMVVKFGWDRQYNGLVSKSIPDYVTDAVGEVHRLMFSRHIDDEFLIGRITAKEKKTGIDTISVDDGFEEE